MCVCLQDYKLLLFHYVIMVTMLGLSYMINTVQIGVLMVFMHNVADIPLEVGACSEATAVGVVLWDQFIS